MPNNSQTLRKKLLLVLFILALGKGLAWAIIVPPFSVPDERDFWLDIKQVAEERTLPWFSVRALSRHPPLFPILVSPVYLATRFLDETKQVVISRLVGVIFGSLLVLAGFYTAEKVFQPNLFAPFIVAALLAFNPQLSYIASSLNSDTLLNLLAAVFFWQLAKLFFDGFTFKRLFWLILLIPLGMLTKERFILFFPTLLVALGLLMLAKHYQKIVSLLLRWPIGLFALASLTAFIYFANLIRVLFLLPLAERLGKTAYLLVAWQLSPLRTLLTSDLYFRERILFKEIWGFFGAPLTLPLSEPTYHALRWFTLVCLLGLVVPVFKKIYQTISRFASLQISFQDKTFHLNLVKKESFSLPTFLAELVKGANFDAVKLGFYLTLFWSLVLTVYTVAVYHFTVTDAQGRYLFTVIVPFFLFLGRGLTNIVNWQKNKLAFGFVLVGLCWLNLSALVLLYQTYY